jgi:hypothetical protein
MRTRSQLLPVILFVLAALSLIVLAAPVANARRIPLEPPPLDAVAVNAGDPDDNGAYRTSPTPGLTAKSIRLADDPTRAGATRAPVLTNGPAALPTARKSEWRFKDVLLYILNRSSILR